MLRVRSCRDLLVVVEVGTLRRSLVMGSGELYSVRRCALVALMKVRKILDFEAELLTVFVCPSAVMSHKSSWCTSKMNTKLVRFTYCGPRYRRLNEGY